MTEPLATSSKPREVRLQRERTEQDTRRKKTTNGGVSCEHG